MTEQPQTPELRRVFSQRQFSVFSVSRQTKLPQERVRYSTIHSAMIFPLRGRARFELNGEQLIGERGTILHGCPHRQLLFEALDGQPFEHINIYYEASPDAQADPHRLMELPWRLVPGDYEGLLARVEALEELNRIPTLESRLNQIVGATNLLRSMFDPSPRSRVDERMARARAYLETHFAETLTLDELAARFGMAGQRFSYCFNRAYGIRPISFLIALRLERAMQLLQTDMLVKDVARSVGYDDPLYFSRLFKRHYGCSPEAARRQRV